MSTIRFLLLEDNPLDVKAIQAKLTDNGIDYERLRVDTCADFVVALETKAFDLSFADYTLPDFDGISALEVARNLCPDVPFTFVYASLGEKLAIETLKQGATDYVLKQRLGQLVPGVKRALRETLERYKCERAGAALRESAEKYRTLIEAVDEGFCVIEMIFAENEQHHAAKPFEPGEIVTTVARLCGQKGEDRV